MSGGDVRSEANCDVHVRAPMVADVHILAYTLSGADIYLYPYALFDADVHFNSHTFAVADGHSGANGGRAHTGPISDLRVWYLGGLLYVSRHWSRPRWH